MPPLNSNGAYYSMVEEVQNYMVLELRKFFGGLAPYNQISNFIPTDLVYSESGPGVPTGKLNIVNEENFDDRRFPSMILTGFSGDTVELGLGQRGLKPQETREPNTVMSVPARAATTGPGNMASDFHAGSIVDAVTLVAHDRIIIKNQVNPVQNGVYDVQVAGAPVRTSDFDTPQDFPQWTTIPVSQGTVNGGRYFSQTTPQPTTLGTDPIQYDDRGLNVLEWDDHVGARNIGLTYSIRARGTSQRNRLTDLLLLAIADKRFVRGEFEKADIFITPPFLRESGSSEEFTSSPGSDMIYRVDYQSMFFTQWSHRLLKTEALSSQITSQEL